VKAEAKRCSHDKPYESEVAGRRKLRPLDCNVGEISRNEHDVGGDDFRQRLGCEIYEIGPDGTCDPCQYAPRQSSVVKTQKKADNNYGQGKKRQNTRYP